MEKVHVYKFSTDEVKKLNHMMPKGYKLIFKEEFSKKDQPQKQPKRKNITQNIPVTNVVPVIEHRAPAKPK